MQAESDTFTGIRACASHLQADMNIVIAGHVFAKLATREILDRVWFADNLGLQRRQRGCLVTVVVGVASGRGEVTIEGPALVCLQERCTQSWYGTISSLRAVICPRSRGRNEGLVEKHDILHLSLPRPHVLLKTEEVNIIGLARYARIGIGNEEIEPLETLARFEPRCVLVIEQASPHSVIPKVIWHACVVHKGPHPVVEFAVGRRQTNVQLIRIQNVGVE